MLVLKKNGRLRLVINYRQLKRQTNKSCFSIRSIEKISTSWKIVVTFPPFTCLGEFTNFRWKKQARTIQRSVHHSDHLNGWACQWTSPAVPRFSKSHGKGSRTPNLEVHNSLIGRLNHFLSHNRRATRAPSRVFERFKDANRKVNPTKWEFLRKEVPFLCQILSREGVQADVEKKSNVRKYPVAENATEVKSLFCRYSYYRRYARNFAKIARPLRQLTVKSKEFLRKWSFEAATHLRANFGFLEHERTFHIVYWC